MSRPLFSPYLSQSFSTFVRRRETRELLRWMAFSLVIGIVAGLAALLFSYLLEFATTHVLHNPANFHPPPPGGESDTTVLAVSPEDVVRDARRWLFLILPALGGLVSGLLVYRFAPEAEGHGTDGVIDAFHNHRGRIRPVVPFVKLIASVATIGTGGSAGREGPIAQIGAGFGSYLGQRLGLSDREVRVMMMVGAGAGIGAIFRAPLGGALFCAAVLYRDTDYEYEVLMPGFMGSIVAYSIFTAFSGLPFGTVFILPEVFVFEPLQLPFFLLLGVAMMAVSHLYVKVFYGMRDHVFRRVPLPRWSVPALGGLLLGIMGFFYPYVLGSGYSWVQQALYGKLTVQFMLTLAFLKIIATSFTISSGGSGGVFAPSLVIGGMLGGAAGAMLAQWNPELFPQPSAFILVGMAAFFAAAAKTPIASMIMVSEMTSGYSLLVPAMLAIAAAYLLSGPRTSIYERQVRNRFESPAHRGEYVVDVMEDMKVSEVYTPRTERITIGPEILFSEISRLFTTTDSAIFPVVDADGRVVGVVPLEPIHRVAADPMMDHLLIAQDIMEEPECLSSEDNLNEALQKILTSGLEELPVLDEEGFMLGSLNRRELLAAYNRRIREMIELTRQEARQRTAEESE